MAKQDDDSNTKPCTPNPVRSAFMVKEQRFQIIRTNSLWFLNLCAFHHLCNDQMLFSNLKAKSIDFVIAVRQVIQIKDISTVSIPLACGDNIELYNVVLVTKCDLNQILLGQLYEAGIIYHDNQSTMTLIQ